MSKEQKSITENVKTLHREHKNFLPINLQNMLESIFQLYLNQKPVQFKNRNINSINTILKLYNR